ncbi:MAG: peptidylprolyl isomerase [Patescibacteria group bacterium]
MPNNESSKKEAPASPEEKKKSPNKTKKNSNKMVIWGVVIGVVVVIAGLLTFVSIRIYKYQADDSFTIAMASWLPFPAAIVDGQWVNYYDVKSDADTLLHYLEYRAAQFPDNELYAVPAYDEIFNDALTQAIETAFIKKQIEKRNINIEQSEIDENVDLVKEEAALYGEDINQTLMDVYNWTLAQFTEKAIVPQLRELKLAESISQDETIEANQEAKTTAQTVYQEVTSGDKTFNEAAAEYSDDVATAQNGGDLGYATAVDYVEEFSQALVALEVDEISEVVQTIFGWHIIKLLEKIEEEGKPASYHAQHILIATKDFGEWLTEEMEKISIRNYVQ